jgi:phospholipid-translocating ATPase
LQTFVLTVTIFREAVDDIRRYQRDKEVNSQKYRRMVRGRDTSELVPSSKLHVGDLVSVYELVTCNAAYVTGALLPRKSESIGKCESLVLICTSAYLISYSIFKYS